MLYNEEELWSNHAIVNLKELGERASSYGTQTYEEYCSTQEDGRIEKFQSEQIYEKDKSQRWKEARQFGEAPAMRYW